MLIVASEIVAANASQVRQFDYIIVQHLKVDTAEFVEILRRTGGNVLQVLGVSYSTDCVALNRLRASGTKVEVPEFSEISLRLLNLVQGLDRPAIILDVGGYGSAVALRKDLSSKVRFIVEDTNNGLWQYQSISPHCPIIEVASIENKSVENAYVGRRIIDGLEQFFAENGIIAPKEDYAVLGFGGIGRSVSSALAVKGINAAVVDLDERKLAIAEALGHKVGKSIGAFSDARVIIGCTGAPSVNFDHLVGLKRGAFLISGSSKRVEFEDVVVRGKIVPALMKNAAIEEVTGAILVNNGEPINLHYGSLNEEISDFMFANIASAIIEGLTLREAGIYQLSDEGQRNVCAHWWNHYRGSSA